MKCLLDLDGVLVDFVGGVCDFYRIPDPYLDPSLKGKWDFVEAIGMSESTFWNPLGEEFWANLKPMPDMENILGIVESVFGRSNVCLLTSPCRNDGCPTGKMRWIRQYLPQYSRQFLMGPRKEFCARDDHWLIDDADHNINAFRKAGGQTCLVPRVWNSLHSERTVPYLSEALRFPKNPSELQRTHIP